MRKIANKPLAGVRIRPWPTLAQQEYWSLIKRMHEQIDLEKLPKNKKGKTYKSVRRAEYFLKVNNRMTQEVSKQIKTLLRKDKDQ